MRQTLHLLLVLAAACSQAGDDPADGRRIPPPVPDAGPGEDPDPGPDAAVEVSVPDAATPPPPDARPPTPDAAVAPSCIVPGYLSCASPSDTGSTHDPGASDVLEEYACSLWTESGPELLYAFTPPASGTYAVWLSGVASSDDLDVFVLEADCAAAACIGYGDSETSFAAVAGRTYYLVVDGYLGDAGGYTLHLDCP